MTGSPWTFDRILAYIKNEVEESATLDYKAGAALKKDDRCKIEITKDISAFANSAGGTLIYGISEHVEKEKAHLPKEVAPVSRSVIPKEWLEHIANNIRPRISGLMIHPVPIPGDEDYVVYVVEVPESDTAHQAKDLRYYRRFNFESVAMEDHEIRQVMSRSQHAKIVLSFRIVIENWYSTSQSYDGRGPQKIAFPTPLLEVTASNIGRRNAANLSATLDVPFGLINRSEHPEDDNKWLEGKARNIYKVRNLVRDIIGHKMVMFSSVPQYGEPRVEPLLPGQSLCLKRFQIDLNQASEAILKADNIFWQFGVDDSAAEEGSLLVSTIEISDVTDESHPPIIYETRQFARAIQGTD